MAQPDDPGSHHARRAEDRAPGSGRPRVQFTWDVSLGQAINGALFLIPAFFLIATYFARVNTTQGDVTALRADMVSRFDAASQTTTKQFETVRADIANLPNVQAELTQLDRRQSETDNRLAAQSTRMEQIQQLGIQTRSDLDAVLRASAAQVKR